MQFVLIVLRLVHIVAGAFWVGSALMLALVILPTPRQPASVRRVGHWVAAITPAVLAAVGLLLVVGWYDRVVALL